MTVLAISAVSAVSAVMVVSVVSCPPQSGVIQETLPLKPRILVKSRSF